MQDDTSRGKKNLKYDYMMLKLGVAVITQEKDPGRIVSSHLKSSVQCTVAARRAKEIEGTIRRINGNKKEDIIKIYLKRYLKPLGHSYLERSFC